jgi:hypothetical protein
MACITESGHVLAVKNPAFISVPFQLSDMGRLAAPEPLVPAS